MLHIQRPLPGKRGTVTLQTTISARVVFDMGAVSVLHELQAEGVQFTVVGDAVTWSGGAGHMTADRLAALKSGKGEVIAALNHHTDAPSPHGQTAGRQRSWTGKVVSLADWRNLSEWERHGSTGKLWNGLTQQWEAKP